MTTRTTRSGKTYMTPDVSARKGRMFESKSTFTRSARKRLGLLGQSTELERSSLTDESVFDEIFKLSPVSPIKRCKENIKPNPTSCRGLLSPLRALTLDSTSARKNNSICKTIIRNRLNTAISDLAQAGHRIKETKKSPRKRVLVDSNANIERATQSQSSPLKDIKNITPVKAQVKDDDSSPSKISKTEVNSIETKQCRKSRSSSSPVMESKISSFDKDVVNNCNDENILPCKTPQRRRHEKDSIYNKVKNALHNSVPKHLVGRDDEIDEISEFIDEHAKSDMPGSLYISGAPGTGKSACLTHVLSSSKVCKNLNKIITVNCMSMRTAPQIYQRVATEMGAMSRHLKSSRLALKYIEEQLMQDGPMILLLLDEMDQLDSKHQEVLYTMFGWSTLKNSRIILVGIANSLDLTDRILPRLQANVNFKPKLINFQPYSKDQLVKILQARILKASDQEENKPVIIDPMAVQFCARKVAAMTGDARKALDVCRRAVEMLETSNMKKDESPCKEAKPVAQKVGVLQISTIISGVYDSNICKRASNKEGDSDDAFPLQQKLIVCALLLLCKTTKCKESPLGKLHETYSSICKNRHVPAVSQSEFFSLCELVESRGIISVKKSKQIRQTKVKLSIQEKDLEFALQGKALLSSILQNGLQKST